MLLPWIDEIGLVPSDINKNILKNFPLPVKRVVVSSIVRYFHSQYQHAISQLSTESHVEWVMEVIGQSFQLPIEDHEVIGMAIDIYQKWIFNEKDRPVPVNANLQYFIQVCAYILIVVIFFVLKMMGKNNINMIFRFFVFCSKYLNTFPTFSKIVKPSNPTRQQTTTTTVMATTVRPHHHHPTPTIIIIIVTIVIIIMQQSPPYSRNTSCCVTEYWTFSSKWACTVT